MDGERHRFTTSGSGPAGEELDALVVAWRAGDETAFTALVRASELQVRGFVISRCRRFDDVEELVQQTYVTALEALDGYEARGCFIPWLKGIARNRIREWNRVHGRVRHDCLDEVLDELWWDLQARRGGEDWWRQRVARLGECLDRLPDQARRLLDLHHIQGYSLNALARRFSRKRAAIARRLFAWRRQLRACIEAEGDGRAVR